MSLARPFAIAAVTASALAASALGGGAVAQAKSPTPDLTKVPKLAAVPPELLAAFPVLAQPRAKRVPGYVVRSWAAPRIVRRYGVDPRQVRAVGGMKGSPWWVVPGTKGICVMVSAGATCVPTADALARGVSIIRTPPPSSDGFNREFTFAGLAPAGFGSVLVTLRTGATTTIPVVPATGAYRGDVHGAYAAAQLLRDGGDPVTLFDLRQP